MRYAGMPWGMWLIFKGSFQKNLSQILGIDVHTAAKITAQAKSKYKELIAALPEFEPEDCFKMNIVNCAMFTAFLLNMEEKPELSKLEEYYESSMMIKPMNWFCRMSGKNKFSPKDIAGMKATAELKAADRNPYSWNMEFYPYPEDGGYEARFTKCGICTLMREQGLEAFIPAMCHLDYAMADASGASNFVREYTIASGGAYCDCGYKKKRG